MPLLRCWAASRDPPEPSEELGFTVLRRALNTRLKQQWRAVLDAPPATAAGVPREPGSGTFLDGVIRRPCQVLVLDLPLLLLFLRILRSRGNSRDAARRHHNIHECWSAGTRERDPADVGTGGEVAPGQGEPAGGTVCQADGVRT